MPAPPVFMPSLLAFPSGFRDFFTKLTLWSRQSDQRRPCAGTPRVAGIRDSRSTPSRPGNLERISAFPNQGFFKPSRRNMASVKKEMQSLSKEKMVEILEKMLVIRYFEEASIKSYQQKK